MPTGQDTNLYSPNVTRVRVKRDGDFNDAMQEDQLGTVIETNDPTGRSCLVRFDMYNNAMQVPARLIHTADVVSSTSSSTSTTTSSSSSQTVTLSSSSSSSSSTTSSSTTFSSSSTTSSSTTFSSSSTTSSSTTSSTTSSSTTSSTTSSSSASLPPATSYSNPGGTGNRTGSIAASGNFSTNNGDDFTVTVDGSFANSLSWGARGATASEIKWDFGTPRLIDEARIIWSGAGQVNGMWKWYGSNDDSSWTPIGSNFILGGVTPQVFTELNGNVTAYRYYRILGQSGFMANSDFFQEIEFKIL